MKRLILIRHGETAYTAKNKYCGHENAPLNAKGLRQAKRLQQRLKTIKIDRIYSSDLMRACETAKIVFKGKAIQRRRGFREIDFGKFSGLTIKGVARTYPKANKIWMENPFKLKIPGGESIFSFTKRVQRCFDRIYTSNPGKVVAVVGHGGSLRVVLLRALRQGFDKFWDIKLPTGGVIVVEFKKGRALWVS